MAENQESTTDIIQELALVTDAMQTMFPDGKIICVYELNDEDFKKVQTNFRKIDHQHKRFSVDISGLEHVFIHEESTFKVEETIIETPKTEVEIVKPKKENISKIFKERILSWFKSGGSSVK
jgi:hypothetical protein